MPGPTCRSTRSLQLRLLAFQKFNLTEQELIFCRDFSKQPNHASVALPMRNLILMMLRSLLTSLRTQAAMQTQIIALHHQVIVLQRTQKTKRLVLRPADRWLWVWLSDFGPAGVPP